jgi:hypothetical protein
MSNGKVGRPRKAKNGVPKARKIKLSKTQKQYAKMIHSIEADLAKKQSEYDALDKKIAALTIKRTQIDNERQNLEGAKKNLEGILSQIPPPPAWAQFTKQVYDYHYHYHFHHDHDCCKNKPCPYPGPVYIGPWWGYYITGGYITYPTQSQLQWGQGNSVSYGQGDSVVSLTGKADIGSLLNGAISHDNGYGLKITTVPCLPNSSVVVPSNGSNFSGFNGSFISHNANLTSFNSVNTISGITSGSTCVVKTGESVNFAADSNVADRGVVPVLPEYTKDDASIAESVTALQAVGFFDMGAPPVDGGDMSVADLAHSVVK